MRQRRRPQVRCAAAFACLAWLTWRSLCASGSGRAAAFMPAVLTRQPRVAGASDASLTDGSCRPTKASWACLGSSFWPLWAAPAPAAYMTPDEVNWSDPRNWAAILGGLVFLAFWAETNLVTANGPLAVVLGREVPQARALHVLVDEEEEARSLLAELEGVAGGPKLSDFSALARERSKCKSAKDPEQPGDLGEIFPKFMKPEFDKVCFDPRSGIGAPLGPVKTADGYHIIWLVWRKGMTAP